MSNRKKINEQEETRRRRLTPIIQFLQANNYKQALKNCDQLLKKDANFLHAQALKAISLNGMGDSEQAFKIAKRISETQKDNDEQLLKILNDLFVQHLKKRKTLTNIFALHL